MSCGCGCSENEILDPHSGRRVSVCSEMALRDPLHARREADVRGQTIGLFAVWPQETRDLIARIDPSMRTTDAAVKACATLSQPSRDAWARYFAAWEKFAAEEVTTFGSARKYDEAEEWRSSLGKWQDELAGTACVVPGPRVSAEDPGAATVSAIKWVSVAVLGASLVYGLGSVLKAFK